MGLARASVVLGLLAACGTDKDISDRPLFPDGFIVFQAVVLDGLDGSEIAPEDVDLRIQIGRHTLTSEVTNGIHLIYGIPDNTSVFVLADAEGYAPFVAKLTIDGQGSLLTGDLDFRFFNVLMYPVGTVPGDLTVTVFSADGTPVDGATVVATQDQQPVFVPVDTPLFPGVGILPGSISQTTAGGGVATFPGADLVLGARYSIDVFGAIDANGVFLVPSQSESVTIGASVPQIAVFLNRPLLTPVAINANNEDGALHANLIVRFPYAIELCTPLAPLSWTNSTNTFAPPANTDNDTVIAGPDPLTPVTTTLSDGNKTLTVNENYGLDTQAFDPDDELFVTFNNVRLKPVGAGDASCRALNQVELRDTNTNVNTTIHVNDP